jgi:Big-like domain-containing protein
MSGGGNPPPPPPPANLATLVVSPQNPVMADNAAAQALTATGHFDDGSTQDLTATATWSSTNAAVATVDGTGHVTPKALAAGVSAGFTSIKAVSGGITGVSIVSVTNHTANPSGFAGVFTQHNDIGRTGQNLNEAALTVAAVSGATFGKKFSLPVDGFIYAQPLYVPHVAIAGGTHNVVYVATENDSVYAFDADASAAPLWKVTLLDSAHSAGIGATPTDSNSDNTCSDLIPTIGVTSTPAIDPSTGTMYVESKTKESGNFFHRLHALDITTGAEKISPPATITTSGFNSLMHTNRPGLLLLNGIVYVAYASDCDNQPYHGWLFAYDATTLTQLAVFNESPNGREGGFWMAGAGIAADSNGNIFIPSGNGNFDTAHVPAVDLGDTILKLTFTGSAFSLEDYFTPFDQSTLDQNDTDLGSGGVLLLPDQAGGIPHELVQAGKEGTIYLINRDQMTAGNKHFCSGCASDTQITQELPSAVGGMWSMPAFWNGNVYFWGSSDNMLAFPITNGALAQTFSSASGTFLGFPGATPSVSAHGNSGGIVWAIDSTNYGQPNAALGPAVLHAYDATNLVTELYKSSANAADTAGNAVKFTVPTIANGKVYVGTQTELDVYGP